MDEEPVVSRDQHNVAWNDFFAGLVLDAENIARPDRRKHAGSECLEAYRAARPENFDRKIELMSIASLCHEGHGRPKNYELFRLKWHCKSVGCTLPQDKAMVSKTRSQRNSGF